MDFLVDENLPNSTAEMLREQGFEAKNIRELGRQGSKDSKVFEVAVENQAVLVTKDLEFGSPEHYDIDRYLGLVIVRLGPDLNALELSEYILEAVRSIGFDDLKGKVTVLEKDRYRTRSL
jgi:predicted nuclease of predicted toxin-antitoxin system